MSPPGDDMCVVCGRPESFPELACGTCRARGWTDKAIIAHAMGWGTVFGG